VVSSQLEDGWEEEPGTPGTPEAEALGDATALRTHLCGQLRADQVGERVRICGWVARRREHGEHLAFVDLRDRSGLVQCVVDGAVEARPEWVVQVEGTVRRRPAGTENPALATGEVELGDCAVTVLNRAEPPPFPVDDRIEVDEVTRLRYRYVDLRRPRLQRNLRVRAAMVGAIRRAMDAQGFCEVETPMLWTPTPEGAREFAVPSRLQPGRFYVLPQSPQIAKQLLMVGGLDRYYQIAKCFRDEDLRADRQFEFTQLDVELSFCEPADVHRAVSRAVLDALHAADRVLEELDGPPAKAPVTTVSALTWQQAMDRYGTDKPDLRIPGEIVDLGPALAGTEVRALQGPCVRALVHPGGAGLGRGRLDALVALAKAAGAPGLAWFRVGESAQGVELDSPLARFLDAERQARLVQAAGARPGDLVLAVAGPWRACVEPLGKLRVELGRPGLEETGERRLCWVTEFPLFDGVDDEGRPAAAHHPFTMPHPEDLDRLESDPASVRSLAYDLVLNGWELGSGSIRVHREDIQRRIFAVLGIGPEEAEARFGFLLAAFRTGAPPHGGFAVGIDRLVALAVGEETIREVVAFPKTQSGADPMTGAPKALGARQLRELGLPPTLGAENPGSEA
jgi:aspartyl-tRNA synthetase